MGHFISKDNNLVIYDAPKTGGTTIRFWIYFYLYGKLPEYLTRTDSSNQKDDLKYIHSPKKFSKILKGYNQVRFSKYSNKFQKICIYRDPVERFISCYNDKIISEGKWKRIPGMKDPMDVDAFIEGIKFLKPKLIWRFKRLLGIGNDQRKNYINFHFQSLTYHYGNDPNYFDKVFDIKDLNSKLKPFLEDIWNIELPEIHTRNSDAINQEKIKFLPDDIKNKVIKMYSIDYESEWSKIQ